MPSDRTKAAEICRDNLERLKDKFYSVTKRNEAHIAEATRIYFTDLKFDTLEDFEENLRNRYRALSDILELDSYGRILLSRCIAELLKNKGISAYERLLDIKPHKKAPIISYLRNVLSDSAYNIFASVFEGVRVSYSADFNSVLEEVYYENADYAILPLYSEDDGRIKRFFDMLRKYDLKISLLCNVCLDSDENSTVFALLSKNIEHGFLNEATENHFDVVLNGDINTMTDILSAAKFFSVSLCSVYTDTGDNDIQSISTVRFDVSKGNINAFVLYLSLEHPRAIPLGLYRYIN